MVLPFIYVLTSGVSNALIGVLAKQAERTGCRPQVVPLLFLGTAALCAAFHDGIAANPGVAVHRQP